MTAIAIREQQRTDTGFTAILSFNGEQEYPIQISDPFDPTAEKELEWYFEEWLVFPLIEP
ncbi:MAG: hypothetical protein KME17_30845 [Cyanosarcina radialis HA8281-LM2]|jgi:hypothetical protein|nr:hypothetical protein [Cyanosarcina radialis HA8281-LM2]